MELILKSPKYGEKKILFDDEDHLLIEKYHWNIAYVRGNWYAVANVKGKQIKMHRLVLHETNPLIKVDHQNNYGLDNRKANLRRATVAQNTRNTGPNKLNRTGYKGVYEYAKGSNKGRFTACLKINGVKMHGGYFNTAIEAAEKYNELAKAHHVEFAFINKIDEEELIKAKLSPKGRRSRTPKMQNELKVGFHGITRVSGSRKRPFRVQMKIDGKSTVIGYFENAIDAAKAYNEALIKHGGDLRMLNKIPNE